MCGICGIYGLEQIESPETLIHRMNQKMEHRGPDASGSFVHENVALGHRRLSIIDLNSVANQPMHSTDGELTLVFNGEIYNYREIKSQIDNYTFITNSDSEVILAAYQKWGINAIQRFNGMFAFALWDNRKKQLFVVRDRLGIKPLYYSQQNHSLVFASEIRALLASGLVNKRMNSESLVDYLRYQTVHAPHTMIEGVQMLMPGHYLSISDNEIRTVQYWSLVENTQHENLTLEETQQKIASLFRQSVKKRLVADVPFGAFLSGGIDSSLVVAAMAQEAVGTVKTFCVTFEDEQFSEARYARMVAEQYGTNHQEIRLSPSDFLLDLPDALQAMDYPSGDGPNTYIVSKATRAAGVTMALSGLGGDELFAGYDIFRRSYDLQQKKWLLSFPKWIRNIAGKALQMKHPGISGEKMAMALQADYFDLEYTYWISRLMMPDERIAMLLNQTPAFPNRVFSNVHKQVGYGNPGFNLPFLSQVSVAEISTYMQNVLLRDTDQMSMAHALEVRVPFLDHELVQFALGIPDSYKFPHSPKKLLVDAFKSAIPKEVVDRPKMGFTFPWNHWLKNELRGFTADHLSDLSKRNIFKKSGIESLWSAFEANDPKVNWSRIWYLVVLENWLKQNGIEA
jgi:asparagine synthase (glutamine-hydrolysing)